VQQLTYALQWKGQVTPETETVFVVHETIKSCSITTVVNSGGITGGFDPAAVADGEFRTRVEVQQDGKFTEAGTIRFGEHALFVSTKVPGWLEQSPDPQAQHGTVTFEVIGGEGQFDGARGIITSNFSITDDGEVTEHQVGVLYIR
jgi:hypothetical protein